jgi:hypothetical protein
MPIELGIWRIDGTPERVPFSALQTEKKLEDVLNSDLSVLDPGLLLVGRQVLTAFGKFIDLLAIDAEGDLVVIELKREQTPRDVVAQVLDYASWVRSLGAESVAELYASRHQGASLATAFKGQFGQDLPERINTGHRLVVVAASLDPETERIIGYLADDYGVPINAVFFRYFQFGEAEFLTRTWLIDPAEAEEQSLKAPTSKKVQGNWNGLDFFVNIGESEYRRWEDARRYGFVAAGQSRWASSRLEQLSPGKRIFACVSGVGYVGVGVVTGNVVPVKEFQVLENGQTKSLLSLPLTAPHMDANVDDPELCEYVVPVRWVITRPTGQAFWRTGMFANQNPACRLRDTGTLELLAEHFGVSRDGAEIGNVPMGAL